MQVLTYYNEFDKNAAAWLRELGRQGHINHGDVDERSIAAVRAKDLEGVKRAHFFAGIGGWDYALRLAGFDPRAEVWTGSCPCQPFSNAGLRAGTKDERHLWPQFKRLIAQRRPATIFGEQVASSLGRDWLAGVRADLEKLGYEVGSADLCAAGVGAPHIRQRLYWVAYAKGQRWHGLKDPAGTNGRPGSQAGGVIGGAAEPLGLGRRGRTGATSGNIQHGSSSRREEGADGIADRGQALGVEHPESFRREQRGTEPSWGRFELRCGTDGKYRRLEPGLEPLVNGLPGRVGLLRGYGNAIVPELAAVFVKAFMAVPE
jgi:DNA (cytosine-5)-methyltransferase 1